MELEIKGFIEFCKAIASNPIEVSNSKDLVECLSFCIDGLNKCNCSNKKESTPYEQKYLEIAESFSEDSLRTLGAILDPSSIYSDIYISFPHTDKKIKIK